ncbi:hypothetical protein [Nocardia nova]|jgi:hypothetical protein|uniref:hypothetical protein n=1 Tax=Nocardia nova TaxID=37330 RepID=UPI0018936F3E|nr:hypothetical protein [Nocardia nova]MBF6148749.1 hypothetical protein [Nocardia nova]
MKTGNTTTNPIGTSIYRGGGSRRRRFDRTGIDVARATDASQCAISKSNTVVTTGRRYESPEPTGDDIATSVAPISKRGNRIGTDSPSAS